MKNLPVFNREEAVETKQDVIAAQPEQAFSAPVSKEEHKERIVLKETAVPEHNQNDIPVEKHSLKTVEKTPVHSGK